MNKEIKKLKVGRFLGSIPPIIQLAKRRSQPISVMRDPEAQASVKTMDAGKTRDIPTKKASTDSRTDRRDRVREAASSSFSLGVEKASIMPPGVGTVMLPSLTN